MPTKKDKNKSHPLLVKAKLAFLATLIVGGLIISLFVKNDASQAAKKQAVKPLPKPTEIVGQVQGVFGALNFDTVENKAVEAQQYLISAAHKQFDTTASQASEVAHDYLFDSAIKPIVQQIDRLPQNDQKKLREYVCD